MLIYLLFFVLLFWYIFHILQSYKYKKWLISYISFYYFIGLYLLFTWNFKIDWGQCNLCQLWIRCSTACWNEMPFTLEFFFILKILAIIFSLFILFHVIKNKNSQLLFYIIFYISTSFIPDYLFTEYIKKTTYNDYFLWLKFNCKDSSILIHKYNSDTPVHVSHVPEFDDFSKSITPFFNYRHSIDQKLMFKETYLNSCINDFWKSYYDIYNIPQKKNYGYYLNNQ